MFRKVLVANRGEIACRIIRTCRRLGVRSVAIYSDADATAFHVRMADEACRIGRPPPSESYLNIPAILQAARLTEAEAVHPGYGFLSQNTAFAQACREAGLTFVGPTPQVMEKMGDKLQARHLAREAGLPLVPGTEAAVNDSEALGAAQALGFPVMVKAAEGGGGIGIQIVSSPEAMKDVVQRARTLARSAFGSPRVYLERYIERTAHVEVQVLGDHHSNLVHLLERDCSVQRRHQKVVEETPCIKLNDAQRQTLSQAALTFARHVGYTNAGTVEFLVAPSGDFFFLEMNTRLQVEHGITEMVTGLDLVELQLRIAAGEPLPFTQKQVTRRGHAIECRVYAEDPDTFLPSPGTVLTVKTPLAPFVRVDSALSPGYEVTTYYDPLLAKVMSWHPNRKGAIHRLRRALRSFRIEGVKTNIPRLLAVLADPAFLTGSYDTTLLTAVATRPRRTPHQPPAAAGRTNVGAEPPQGNSAPALAAAVAVALALTVEESAGTPNRPPDSRWRRAWRGRQMLSRLGVRAPW
ncbi:MAG: ATP-grasp domain-containing protein [Chloroflexi bacterium]|nr:ATP-grasp domain-containing protein [Chloroflexota bacterium]